MKLPSFIKRFAHDIPTVVPVLPRFLSHEHCITFSALIREHWDQLGDLTHAITFERNATIYAIGDRASTIYSILDGRVKLGRLSPSGREQILGICGKSDIFGEICFCGGTRREEQAVAMERTDAFRFNTDELLELVKSRPDLLFELCMILCSRLHESQEQLARLVFDDTRQRLAKQLLLLSQAFHPDQPAADQAISLTHEELAQFIGTTRERVTALLNEFRRMGLVDYATASIRVHRDRTESYLHKYPLDS